MLAGKPIATGGGIFRRKAEASGVVSSGAAWKGCRNGRWIGFLIACAVVAAQGAEEGHGRIALLGTNTVSLGAYPNTEDRTARVQITNVGTGTLRVERVVTTCTCMRIDAYPASLGPGKSGEVAVTIKKNEVSGVFERVFFIESSDPENPRVRVRVEGDAQPLFVVTCDAKTMLGPVEAGLVWTGRYTVAATEVGLSLGEPVADNRGTVSSFSVRTNQQARLVYEVTRTVTFEGAGNLESVLIFPVLRQDGQAASPVRLSVEAVRRIPLKVVPDRLMISPAQVTVTRRLLLFVSSEAALDAQLLTWDVPVEGIEVRPALTKSGKGFFVDLSLSAEAVAKLAKQGGGSLNFQYKGGFRVEVPVQLEL